MRRGVKIGLAVGVVALVVVATVLIVFFTNFNPNTYRVVGTDFLNYSTKDLSESELRLFDNGTFHVKIVHKDEGVLFIGIGTYQKSGNNYEFTYNEVIGKRNNVLTDQTEKYLEPVIYQKKGNRIQFIDHDNHIYYFG